MGSKNRIAKHLLPILLKARGNRVWVEPFVGGANMINKVRGYRIGNDSHEYLIALLKAVQSGWVPPTTVDRDLYYQIKNNQQYYPAKLVGFVGFACSFGGKWWGGYAKDLVGRNRVAEGSRNLTKQFKNFKDIDFRCGNYLDLKIPLRSFIYCDPPYEGTTKYRNSFNHTEFWQWCRQKTNEGHVVYVSEYSAPKDFKYVKIIETVSTLHRNIKFKKIEKLFTYVKNSKTITLSVKRTDRKAIQAAIMFFRCLGKTFKEQEK